MKTPSLDARNLVFFIILLMRAIHIQKLFNVKQKELKPLIANSGILLVYYWNGIQKLKT
jgi:hypothetical protein